MNIIYLLLLIAGLVLFLLGAAGRPGRWDWIALGLACWILVEVLQTLLRVAD